MAGDPGSATAHETTEFCVSHRSRIWNVRTTLPSDVALSLDTDGRPRNPMVVVDLDRFRTCSGDEMVAIAVEIAKALPLVVGVFRGPVDPGLGPVMAACTVTLTDQPVPHLLRQVVAVDDLEWALDALHAAVTHSPRAALVGGQLLRQTARLETTPALAAEAAAYSMLLAGTEFRTWLTERGPARTVRYPDRDLVRVHRDGNHLSVVLDHQERRNALSMRLREELLSAAQLAAFDPTIESVDLSGAGTVFCSGGDLDEFGNATDHVAAYMVRLDRAPWAMFDRIAHKLRIQVQGDCVGAGAELAAFGGTVVARPDTRIRLPEIGMGLVPGAGGTVSIPRRIGRWRAAWLMLTGHSLPAATAREWGLIDHITLG